MSEEYPEGEIRNEDDGVTMYQTLVAKMNQLLVDGLSHHAPTESLQYNHEVLEKISRDLAMGVVPTLRDMMFMSPGYRMLAQMMKMLDGYFDQVEAEQGSKELKRVRKAFTVLARDLDLKISDVRSIVSFGLRQQNAERIGQLRESIKTLEKTIEDLSRVALVTPRFRVPKELTVQLQQHREELKDLEKDQ